MADFTPKSDPGKAKGSGPGAKISGEDGRPPHLYLEHHHLEKLGLTKMPPVGSKIRISGLAHVGATSENSHAAEPGEREGGTSESTGKGTRRSMTLHLHKMDIGTDQQSSDADREEQSAKGAKAAMDKALVRGAGSEAAKGTAKGKTPTPRGGEDDA